MGRVRGLWVALLAAGAVLGAPTFRDPYDCVEAAYGLATAGRNEEATKTFEVCARLGEQAHLDGGTMAQIYFNLGQSYMQLGDLLRAKATFEKALVVNPRLDQALVKLAFIANEQGDAPATVSLLTRALALSPPGQPRDPSLLEYLADTLNNLKQFAKAVELYREALGSLKRAPLSVKRQREPELRLRLGDALVNLKKSSEAAEQFRLGLQRAPRHQGLWASWFHNLIFRCDWGSLSNVSLALQSSVSAALARGDYSRLSPYSALFVDLDEGLRVNISATWVRETRKSALPFEPLVANVRASVASALEAAAAAAVTDSDAATATSVPVFRVGLISRRFESYAGTQLLLALPRALRRPSVHVTCFASGPDDHSLERETLRRDCDDFVDLSLATVEAGFQMIAERGVNVLVDYDGLHEFNNLKTLALRPSPTQLSFLGFAGPINPSRPGKRNLTRATRAAGSPTPDAPAPPIVDGLLVDPVVVPPETLARTYADRLVYLPRTYQPQDPETYTRLVRALAESAREAVAGALTAEAWSSVVQVNRTQLLGADRSSWTVFAAFNRVAKIEPMIWTTWMQVLRRTPRSVLWLYRDEDEPVERLLAEAEAQGVPRSRILVAPKVPKAEHLARHALADVFLDTRVYGAHTSASDALTSGLPVVTTPGASFASRVGASLARAAHSPHTVTASLRDYEALSARLGRQRDTLAFPLRRQILEQNLLAPRALQASHPALFHIDAFANEWLAATRAAGELRAHDWGHLVLPANQPER